MDELNGRILACQLLLTGLIARAANAADDPLAFLTLFRDEARSVIHGVRILGVADSAPMRDAAARTVDEMFGLMKPPSED